MEPSTLYFTALNDAFSGLPLNEIALMLDTSRAHGCSRLWLELVACDNADRSESYDIPCGRSLAAELTVRTSAAFSFATVRLPLGAGEV